jgi:TolB-like protein
MDFWLGTAYLALAQAHFADRDFAAAKDMGSRALALKPSSLRGAIVAASCAHLDEAEEAARRLKELKAIGSDFLASLLDGSYTLYRNPGHNALLVDGLRTAESPRGDVEAPPSEALPLPDKPSIAVLPFNNMSGDQEQDYFSDGITEDIITELSRFPTLFVIARNSSFSYKGQAVDVRRVAEELGVRYVLEGSIRRAGSRVRITAQLIDSETGKHVWAERRNLEDIFALQEEITANVVGAIAPQIEMAEIDRVRGVRSGNVSAYDLALKSQALFYDGARKGSPEIHRQALDTAAAALEQDPRNAHALWIRAWACVEGYLYRWGPDPDELLKEAWTAVERLVDVDSSDPLCLRTQPELRRQPLHHGVERVSGGLHRRGPGARRTRAPAQPSRQRALARHRLPSVGPSQLRRWRLRGDREMGQAGGPDAPQSAHPARPHDRLLRS